MKKAPFLFSGTVGYIWDMEVAVGIGSKEIVSNRFQDKEINAITQVNVDSSGDHDVVNRCRSVYCVTGTEPAFYVSHLIEIS